VIPVLFYLGVFRGLENRVLYGYLTANVALLAVGLFRIMQRGAPYLVQWKTPLQQVGGDTFGIYLVHLMILRRVVQPIIITHGPEFPLLQIPATAAATFLLSLCLVELIRMLPGFLPYLLLGTDESRHPAGTFGGG
jgi:surface polysaccharide O-acyltransferase-like enzyme